MEARNQQKLRRPLAWEIVKDMEGCKVGWSVGEMKCNPKYCCFERQNCLRKIGWDPQSVLNKEGGYRVFRGEQEALEASWTGRTIRR